MNIRVFLLGAAIAAALVILYEPDAYYINLLSRILIAATFAQSLNILMGYGGLMSLGHAAFSGISAYTLGILSVQHGLSHLSAAILAVIAATVSAAAFGYLALRSKGIGFLMLTLALAEIVWGLALRYVDLTGGDNGLAGITRPVIFGFSLEDAAPFFVLALLVYSFVHVFTVLFVGSAFGAALQGARDQPRRMCALGFKVWRIQWASFILAGALAGMSGIMSAYYNQFVSPYSLALSQSAEALLMVIAGGAATIYGPLAGAIVVLLVTNVVSSYTDHWHAVLGMLFISIVFFLPEGIVPGLMRLIRHRPRSPVRPIARRWALRKGDSQ
jgi:branched-chain amino acid transport system permease protein